GHLDRLRLSATYFDYGYDEADVRSALERAAAAYPDRALKVRLLLDRRGRVETGAAPLGASHQPARLAGDRDHPVDPVDPMLFHKTTLRERYDEAALGYPD